MSANFGGLPPHFPRPEDSRDSAYGLRQHAQHSEQNGNEVTFHNDNYSSNMVPATDSPSREEVPRDEYSIQDQSSNDDINDELDNESKELRHSEAAADAHHALLMGRPPLPASQMSAAPSTPSLPDGHTRAPLSTSGGYSMPSNTQLEEFTQQD